MNNYVEGRCFESISAHGVCLAGKEALNAPPLRIWLHTFVYSLKSAFFTPLIYCVITLW